MSCVAAVRTLCEFTARAGDLDLHARADRPGRRGRARRGDAGAAPAMKPRLPVRRIRRTAGARPRRRPTPPSAWKRSRPIADAWTACAEPPRRALGAGQGLRPSAVPGARPARPTVALVYFNVATEEETMLAETHPAAELEVLQRALRAPTWPGRGRSRRTVRDAALEGIALSARIPRRPARAGVAATAAGAMAAACWRRRADRHRQNAGHLAAARPRPRPALDKLFFPGRQGPGRAPGAAGAGHAERAAGRARPAGAGAARDKLCEHPDKACHGESCPLARGFYDRLPRARAGALAHGRMDAAALRQVAAAHDVCPYYLAQGIDALERRGGG